MKNSKAKKIKEKYFLTITKRFCIALIYVNLIKIEFYYF